LNDKSSDATLFKTIETMLAGIEDPHVELSAKVAGAERTLEPGDGVTLGRLRAAANGGGARAAAERKWRDTYERGILQTVLQGKGRQAANGRLFWGRVADIG